jgi:hypothetical protein
MVNLIGELRNNIPAGAVPPVNIPGVPAQYQVKDVKVEDVEAVFGLLKKFTTTLLAKPTQEAPAAPEAETVVKTKRSPQEVAYNTIPYADPSAVPSAVPEPPKFEAIEKVFDFMLKFISELKANIPADGIPPINIPPVNIPTGAIPTGAIPTGAIPDAGAYSGVSPYQPKEVKIEEIEAVFGLLKKFTSQLLANPALLAGGAPTGAAPAVPVGVVPVEAAPVEVVPVEAAPVEVAPVEVVPVEVAPADATYQLIEAGCKNSVGLDVPCAVRRRRSPQVPVAYNTLPLNYQPLPYTVATPVTYQTSEPVVTENKPKIEDIEKVFEFMSKFIGGLKASIPADAVKIPQINIPPVNIPPVNIPPVNIPPVNIPSVEVPPVNIPTVAIPTGAIPTGAIPTGAIPTRFIPTGPINGAVISGF